MRPRQPPGARPRFAASPATSGVFVFCIAISAALYRSSQRMAPTSPIAVLRAACSLTSGGSRCLHHSLLPPASVGDQSIELARVVSIEVILESELQTAQEMSAFDKSPGRWCRDRGRIHRQNQQSGSRLPRTLLSVYRPSVLHCRVPHTIAE
jgi:hypothetical protein